MGKLVSFDPLKRRAKRKALAKPPSDPLERASWLHDLLCAELADVAADDKLADGERRELVLKFASKITQALPHHEIAAARDEVRGDEDDSKGASLGGTVTHVSSSGARPIRAQAPRRKG